ncbi:MAG: TetR/AcrR family transcriptional regulator [Ktedonobacteraceae bacterium]
MPRKVNRMGLDRAAVVQAAAALIDTMGLEQVTMADLAERLQIRTPSLYNHINGMTGLRRDLALFGMRELATRMGQVVMGKAGDDAIIALAHAYRAFVKEHPGLYTATLRAPASDDTELQKAAQEVIDILLKVLSAYNLQAENAIHAIRLLRSTIHGFTSLEIAGGFELPIELDETFRHLINMFLMSIRQ